MSCPGGVGFSVIIEEDGEIIYDKRFASESILKVKAQKGSAYIVTVCNESIGTGKHKFLCKVRRNL